MKNEYFQNGQDMQSWLGKGSLLKASCFLFLAVSLGLLGIFLPKKSVQALALPEASSVCTIVISELGDDANDGSVEYPYQTIQKAVEVSQPGDVICLREGTYREFNLMFPGSGTIESPITMKNYPGEAPVLDEGDVLDNWHVYSEGVFYTEDFDHSLYVTMVTEDDRMLMFDHSSSPDTLIEGGMLKVDNRIYVRPYAGSVKGHTFVLTYRPSAVVFNSTSHIILEGLTFKHYNNETVLGDGNSHNLTIRDCVFKNNVRTALRFDGDNILVENCDISWSGVFGLLFMGEHSVARNCTASYVTNAFYATHGAHDILFEGCEASHFARRGIPNTNFRGDGDGVGLGPSTEVVVRNCHFHDSGNDFPISEPEEQSGHVFDIWKAERFTIENNIVHGVHTAFTVAPGRDGLIQNNLIYDIEGNAIPFWGGAENPGYNNKVYNNTIFNCGNNGIHISPYTTNVEIKNNIVMNCGGYEFSVVEAEGHVEDHNLFFDENSEVVISWLGSAKTIPQYQRDSGQGANSLGLNPQFLDIESRDFHLVSSSPAVDTGVELTNLTSDIEGTSRPQGSGYDMGAYEFTNAPTFMDVPFDHWAYDYIEVLYQEGYVAGCSLDPLLYCPERIMNRAESAVFVERGIHGAGYLPPDPMEQIFADVALAEWYAKWATQLWVDGYTAGCGTDPLIYCPLQGHTIAEGCVFYLRMMNGTDYEPPDPIGIFADVPQDAWYARWIEDAYAAGILLPCQTEPELMACPLDGLDRAMGAYMMVQAKGLD